MPKKTQQKRRNSKKQKRNMKRSIKRTMRGGDVTIEYRIETKSGFSDLYTVTSKSEETWITDMKKKGYSYQGQTDEGVHIIYQDT